MDLIWNLISIFGLGALLVLGVAFWTQWEMTRKQREQEEESRKERQKNTPP